MIEERDWFRATPIISHAPWIHSMKFDSIHSFVLPLFSKFLHAGVLITDEWHEGIRFVRLWLLLRAFPSTLILILFSTQPIKTYYLKERSSASDQRYMTKSNNKPAIASAKCRTFWKRHCTCWQRHCSSVFAVLEASRVEEVRQIVRTSAGEDETCAIVLLYYRMLTSDHYFVFTIDLLYLRYGCLSSRSLVVGMNEWKNEML